MIDLLVRSAVLVSIFSLLVMSLNIQYGVAGLFNFGTIAFYAAGAVGVAAATLHGWPVWVGIAAGVGGSLVLGVLMVLPSGRLKEVYWALLTLGIAELVIAAVSNEDWLAGGTGGTGGIPQLATSPVWLAVMLALVAAGGALFEYLRRSQFGRVLRAMREDEDIVTFSGRSTAAFRLRIVLVAAVYGGVSGAAYGHFISFVSPDAFLLTQTFLIWAMMIIGGLGSALGSFVGTVIVQGLLVGTRFLPDWIPLGSTSMAVLRMVIVGVLLVAFVLYRPDGLAPERRARLSALGA